MADKSKIEWTDATWNPVRGCTKVSPGCAHCYAETFAERWRGIPGHAYEQGFDLRLVPEKLAEPLSWKTPQMVFVNSMSDLFHKGVPFDYIDRVFAIMALASKHTFQVLTKRPERMAEYVTTVGQDCRELSSWERGRKIAQWCSEHLSQEQNQRLYQVSSKGWWEWQKMPNVWLGTSVEDQQRADERIPHLLDCPAAVRFLSCEPLISAVDLRFWNPRDPKSEGEWLASVEGVGVTGKNRPVDWVIVGGESGPKARPCNIDWIRDIVRQCREAGVPCFVKQLGSRPHENGKRLRLSSRKGGDMSEWPNDLRVREFPERVAV